MNTFFPLGPVLIGLAVAACFAFSGCAAQPEAPTYIEGELWMCTGNKCSIDEDANRDFKACLAKGSVISRCLKAQ